MTTQIPLVIYHANCADGFTAAWAVHKAMPADFHAATYQATPPDVTGRDVIMVAIFSRPYSFTAWDALAAMDPADLQREGAVLERKHHKDVAELVTACARRMVIAGHDVPAASIPYTMASDAGAILAQGEHFAACYYDTAHTREFSLRSHADGVDVSIIAGLYGGGGHARAAGFRVPRDHELAKA